MVTHRVATLLFGLNALMCALLVAGMWQVRAASASRSAVESSRASFRAALGHARDLSRDEVDRNLMPVRSDNSVLLWHPQPDADDAKVLVAAWSGYGGYPAHRRKACSLRREVWVTPTPQLRQACRSFGLTGQGLKNRMTQYLGLQPPDGKSRRVVVEFWVRPGDLFRPCADPEISDEKCDLGLPRLSSPPTQSEIDHALWFERELQEKYYTDPYPWTRLGYTYDWGSERSHHGASEYVIRKDAVVSIAAVYDADDYCRGDHVERAPPSTVAADQDAGC